MKKTIIILASVFVVLVVVLGTICVSSDSKEIYKVEILNDCTTVKDNCIIVHLVKITTKNGTPTVEKLQPVEFRRTLTPMTNWEVVEAPVSPTRYEMNILVHNGFAVGEETITYYSDGSREVKNEYYQNPQKLNGWDLAARRTGGLGFDGGSRPGSRPAVSVGYKDV